MLTLALLVACTDEEPRDRHRPDPTEPPAPAPTGGTPPTGPEPPTPPEPLPDPGEWLLETDEVRTIALTIGHDELDSLAMAPEAWVPANLAIGDVSLERVAVRLKGNGSFQPIDQKPSWKVSLDRYVPDQDLDGLDEIVLNNMVTDASYLRERAAYAAYREVGVPAPRATHVQVLVNGDPYGLYLMLEDVDGRFLERWFADADGPLYEMFDVDLTPAEVWQLEHESGPDDRAAFVGLADVLADPVAQVSVDGEPFLDVDQFAAYFGASAVVGQFDAYPYSFPGDDVYLYVDPADDRVHFLAHGADEAFADPFRPADYVFGLLAIRCLADVACEERWTAAVWSAQDTVETMDLVAQINAWWVVVEPHVATEPRSPWTTVESAGAFLDLRDFVSGRRARLEAMPGLR